jgi:hypothetical protein
MDLNGYSDFMEGKLVDHELSREALAQGLTCLEGLPVPASR